MAITFNETSVTKRKMGAGVTRRRLLTPELVNDTGALLDRLALTADASVEFEVSAKSLAWLHVLEGEATLKTLYADPMPKNHSAFLQPGYRATLSAGTDASVLYAEIPDAKQLDPGFSSIPPIFNVLNWTREPVLKSQSDARSRVALVTPELCHTAAMKIEMVIYPPGSTAPTYHHEGAESFVYIVSGSGNCRASERSFPVRQGDFIYFPDREPHHLATSDKYEMRFLVFYAPGAFKTVWADPSKKSAWVSTGRDINGYETADDQRERRTFAKAFGGPITR